MSREVERFYCISRSMLMNSVSGNHAYFDSKQVLSECNLALDAWSIVVDVTAFDGWDRLYPGEGCFGSSQGSEALAITKQSPHGRVIVLTQATAPLSGTDRRKEHARRGLNLPRHHDWTFLEQ